MVLAEDVRTANGEVFLARGQDVSASMVEKLRNFAASGQQMEETCLVSAKPSEWLNDTIEAPAPSRPEGSAAPPPAEPAPPAVAPPAEPAAPVPPPPSDAELDPVTGLPDKFAAKRAIEELCQGEPQWYVAVLALDSMATAYARYGRRAGDALLHAYAVFLAEQLTPEDRLFRWSGPVLVAVLPRLDDLDHVRGGLQQLIEHRKFQHAVRAGSRSIPLSVAPRWTVLQGSSAPATLLQKIDSFLGVPPS